MSDRDIPIAIGPWKLIKVRPSDSLTSTRHVAVYEREIKTNYCNKANCHVEIEALMFDLAHSIRTALENQVG